MEREIETSMMRENHQSAASCMPHTRDGAHMCPDQESNCSLQFIGRYSTTEQHQPGYI